MKSNKVFNFHSDSQHGWLAVKKADLDFLGIKNVSQYSYVKGNTVYLEEDCDAGLFFKAFELKFGLKPKCKECYQPYRNSPIRNFDRMPQNKTLTVIGGSK